MKGSTIKIWAGALRTTAAKSSLFALLYILGILLRLLNDTSDSTTKASTAVGHVLLTQAKANVK